MGELECIADILVELLRDAIVALDDPGTARSNFAEVERRAAILRRRLDAVDPGAP